jgi:hypothetical protein
VPKSSLQVKIGNHYYDWPQAGTNTTDIATRLKDDSMNDRKKGRGEGEVSLEVPLNGFIHWPTNILGTGGRRAFSYNRFCCLSLGFFKIYPKSTL